MRSRRHSPIFARSFMPGPIEAHLAKTIAADLALAEVGEANIAILSADAETWCFRVTAKGRTLESGFNHTDQLWCREVTPGREKHLISNDAPHVGASQAARRAALQVVRHALANPFFAIHDPPVV